MTNINPQSVVSSDAVLHPLIPYDLVFDLDVSLIRLIKNQYNDPDMFDTKVLNEYTIQNWIYLLIHRDDPNPLTILMEPGPEADELYRDFLDKKMKELCEFRLRTNLFTAILYMQQSSSIFPTIWCKNEYQEKVLLEYKNKYNLNYTLESHITKIDVDIYDPLYIKNIRELLLIKKNVKRKNLYIADYGFNYQLKDNHVLLVDEVVKPLKSANVFKIASIYENRIELFNPDKKETS